MERKLGALPPQGLEWQIGKTKASIDFVKEAEFAIKFLQELVDKIKNGETFLDETVSVKVPETYRFKYIGDDKYVMQKIFKTPGEKEPITKRRVILVPAELDVAGEGMLEGCWWVVRGAEKRDLLGFLPTHSDGPVVTGPSRFPCEPFDIEVIDIGD